jgi:signal recognition particle subunit SRP54
MKELEDVKKVAQPQNIFFVADAMIGQDAVKTASEFHRRIGMTGFILTKLDGDARGGAALSIKEVTGKPIKFLGMGEGLDAIEEFRPEGLASRILGMGDIVGLMQDFSKVMDESRAEEDALKMLKGQFNFNDFLDQLRMIKKMGSLQSIFEKMPFFNDMIPAGTQLDDRELVRIEAMVNSMTNDERLNPDIIDESRIRRIARGSGNPPKEVKGLLERFTMARQMMGELGQATGLLGRLGGLGKMGKLAKKLGKGGMPMGMPGMGMPGMGRPGMGGMPGMGGGPMMMGLPGGQVAAGGGGKSAEERRKEKNKKKAAAKMKKKQRR